MPDASIYQLLPIDFDGQTFHIRYLDVGQGTPILYLHGWGTFLHSFEPLIDSLGDLGRHIAIDFPGFGQSTRPEAVWNTEDYARFVAALLERLEIESTDLIVHSFGGRVAIRLAVMKPECIRRMVLIAAAGLRRPQPWLRRMRVKCIQLLAKTSERLIPGKPGQALKQSLYHKIASRDYLQAGEMRPIFVRVVNEDLSDLLPNIEVPVLLIYGSDDTETPPWAGQKCDALLPHSTYIELPGFDHNSILDRGRHQVSHQIRNWIQHV